MTPARSEYDPVSWPLGRAGSSVVCWLVAFVYGGSYDWSKPMLKLIVVSMVLLCVGVALAWTAPRQPRRTLTSRAGLILNGGGILNVVLPVAAYYLVLWLTG